MMTWVAPQVCDFWSLFVVVFLSADTSVHDIAVLKESLLMEVQTCPEFPYEYAEQLMPIPHYPHYCLAHSDQCWTMATSAEMENYVMERGTSYEMIGRVSQLVKVRSTCLERTILHMITNIPCAERLVYPDLVALLTNHTDDFQSFLSTNHIHARILWVDPNSQEWDEYCSLETATRRMGHEPHQSSSQFITAKRLDSIAQLKSLSDCSREKPPHPSMSAMDKVLVAAAITLVSLSVAISALCCGLMVYVRVKHRRSFVALLFSQSRRSGEKDNYGGGSMFSRFRADSWEVDPTVVQIVDGEREGGIGSGAFGVVYRAVIVGEYLPTAIAGNRDFMVQQHIGSTDCVLGVNTVEVAVKRPLSKTPNSRSELLKEIRITKQLGYHVHLVNLLGCCTTNTSRLMILMEHCSQGCLLEFLRERKKASMKADGIDDGGTMESGNTMLKVKDLVLFAWQISSALCFMHSNGFAHCDVACRNVLVTQEAMVKLGDFGLCQQLATQDAMNQASMDELLVKSENADRIPHKWAALELLERAEVCIKSDVWSFAVCLYEIFSFGNMPYPLVQPEDMFEYLRQGSRLERTEFCPDEIYSLMKECWSVDIVERPNSVYVRQRLGALLELYSEAYGYLSVKSDDYLVLSTSTVHGTLIGQR